MTLIPDAAQWHKFWSVRLAALTGFLAATQSVVQQFDVPQLQMFTSSKWYGLGMAALTAAAIGARVITQTKLVDCPPTTPKEPT